MTAPISEPHLVLAGDVGGTHIRLGLFKVTGQKYHLISQETLPSRNYSRLEEALTHFLKKRGAQRVKVASACFGVAGPVIGEVVAATNLPWVVDTASLQKKLSIEKVKLINDLVANAHGISLLQEKDFEVLNAGKKREGNQALLSAGTGLGEAILFWDGEQHIPSPSEGGHVEFAPRRGLEIELLHFLIDRFGHVSCERVLSGEGLLHLYQFLRDSKRFGSEPEWLSKRMAEKDPAEVISEMGRLRKNRLCVRAIDLFVSIYGAAAGNLALQVMALGGVYVGGGIAPKIIWKLKDGTFMRAFKDKGRLSHVLAQIPVKVIMNDKAALLGAARRARDLSRDFTGHGTSQELTN